jgi:2-methylaconitate cis-trans-isomerase PrpF
MTERWFDASAVSENITAAAGAFAPVRRLVSIVAAVCDRRIFQENKQVRRS